MVGTGNAVFVHACAYSRCNLHNEAIQVLTLRKFLCAPILFSDGEEEVFLSSPASMQGEQDYNQGAGEYPEEVDDEEVGRGNFGLHIFPEQSHAWTGT